MLFLLRMRIPCADSALSIHQNPTALYASALKKSRAPHIAGRRKTANDYELTQTLSKESDTYIDVMSLCFNVGFIQRLSYLFAMLPITVAVKAPMASIMISFMVSASAA